MQRRHPRLQGLGRQTFSRYRCAHVQLQPNTVEPATAKRLHHRAALLNAAEVRTPQIGQRLTQDFAQQHLADQKKPERERGCEFKAFAALRR